MPPFSPITPLASSLHAKPGTYALLIGSGVSRASGIQSGWEIAADLTRRLAILEGGEPDDSVAWYRQRHGADIDYSQLIEALATSRGDRQALLKNYLSPADGEDPYRPTEAHAAIAQLVKKKFVRIILTTNFDRLVEDALADVGIRPLVIHDEGSALSAPPLYHAEVVVIKIHGDIESPNIRNTIDELADYGPNMAAVVSEVFSNFGLLICGWSGQWDKRLGRLLQENRCEHFSSYWTHVGGADSTTREIAESRGSVMIPIDDAEKFFPQLVSRISALEGLHIDVPRPRDVLISEIKSLMVNPERRVILEDIVLTTMRESITLTREIASRFPSGVDIDEYQQFVREVWQAADLVSAIFMTLGYYGRSEEHSKLVLRAMSDLVATPRVRSGVVAYLNLQYLPALVALYSLGIGCLQLGDVTLLARCLNEIRPVNDSGRQESILRNVNAVFVLDHNRIMLPQKMKTPGSEYVFTQLQSATMSMFMDDESFNERFDELEFLLSAISMHEFSGAPMGRFTWRHHMREVDPFDGRINQYGPDCISEGLFNGNEEDLKRAVSGVNDLWNKHFRYFF